jgi:hypothetical protein
MSEERGASYCPGPDEPIALVRDETRTLRKGVSLNWPEDNSNSWSPRPGAASRACRGGRKEMRAS